MSHLEALHEIVNGEGENWLTVTFTSLTGTLEESILRYNSMDLRRVGRIFMSGKRCVFTG